ncbi:hypothetical protein AMTR_s00079p00050740 [Amborella trichopoda]|uniref:Protein FAR1-RELATED SEQUENCE n=1 Tax=Amborella trichopoda TaxID=13333 RepID=W1P269_AMBTC|nr:hypothetical protein AMTR_s00079p00050740 [Amborella trichopoda]
METPPNETMLVEGFVSIVENPLERVPSDVVPYHEKIFSSHDGAYEFYKSFAKAWGFSLRRQQTIGKEGDGNGTTRRYYVCHKDGHLTNKELFANKGERDRSSKRCNCGADMSIAKVMDYDISYWRVVTFVNLRNHDVLEPQVRFLPAYRNISESYKLHIQQFSKVGICVRDMMWLLEIERNLKPGELPFLDKDMYNFVCATNNANRDNDAHILLTKYKQIKYDFTVREDNRLEHIVWSHGSCSHAYEIFGDVVVFNTTYRSNGYSMPFGIWVGVNNHGDTCLFGCVLLRDERVQSFSWAMKTFLGLMNGTMSQTILTDQDLAHKVAIYKELPNTKHAFCIWHLLSKLSGWFSLFLCKRYNEFDTDFYKLYNHESIEDFEEGWHALVNKFTLHSNRHINNMWNLKEFWALPYLRSHFFTGMKTT